MVTHPADVHADAVQGVLSARGIGVYRTDTQGLGVDVAATVHLRRGLVSGHLGDAVVENVSCVWHRRPSEFGVADADDAAELRAGVGGVLGCLRYLNHPVDMVAALKPWQLAAAGQAGLLVPDTVVTSEQETFDEVTRQWGGPGAVVVKPMSSRRAGLITPGLEFEWAGPIHLVQRRVEKLYDVRLTVVDHDLFAVRIDSPFLDWRRDIDVCVYRIVTVPATVRRDVLRLMRRLRLRYGAADFAVDGEGRWWFLEVNPNGQWLWLEHATGAPISRAVADALSGAGRPVQADEFGDRP